MPTTTFEQDDAGRWVIDKDPDAELDYTFDWTKWLAKVVDTIDSAEIVLDGDAGPATVAEVQHTSDETEVIVVISGGEVGKLEPVTCRITTVDGRIEDRTVYLNIVER